MAQVYEVIGSISRPTGAVTGYPCRLVVGESAGSVAYGFYQPWDSQPYSDTYFTTVNSCDGILDVTSTGSDPRFAMYGLGSFDPAAHSTIRIRYKVVSGTAGNVEIYFTNSRRTSANDDQKVSAALISDNAWHTLDIDMSAHEYWSHSNVTGWRYDWCTASGVNMQIDCIGLVLDDGVDVHCSGHCQSDFGDIRFFDGSDNALDYWIDWGTLTGTTPNQTVEVWVKTAAATDGTTVKLKYGDAALDDASDGAAVFTLYEDFEAFDDEDGLSTSKGSVTWTQIQGVAKADTAKSYAGSKSGRFTMAATTPQYTIPCAASNDVAISWRSWVDTNIHGNQVSQGDGSKRWAMNSDYSSSLLYYYNASSTSSGGYAYPEQWNKVELKNFNWTNHTYELWLNDIHVATAINMYSDSSYDDAIRFMANMDSSGKSCWYDNIIVRKYANPEPVWGAWGTETEIATELTVAASSHAASSDNVSLIQGSELTVADSASVLTSDGMSLTQVHVLTLGDSSHITDSGIVSLVADFRLAITDSSHLADSDNVGLVPDFRLVVAEPVNVVGSENLELSTSTPLVIASSTSLLSSDNIDLIQLCILVVEGSSSASTSEEPSLSHSGLLLLTIGDSLHSMGADNVEVFQSHVLTVSDSTSLFTPSGELIFLEFWVHPGGVLIGPFGNLELLPFEGNLELLFFSGDLELLSFAGGLE